MRGFIKCNSSYVHWCNRGTCRSVENHEMKRKRFSLQEEIGFSDKSYVSYNTTTCLK